MPVIKSAIKKLRHDKKIEKENDVLRTNLEKVVKTAKKTKTDKSISLAFSAIDKAVKKHLIHKNKAARIKSSLSKLRGHKQTAAQAVTKENKTVKTAKKTGKAPSPKPKAVKKAK